MDLLRNHLVAGRRAGALVMLLLWFIPAGADTVRAPEHQVKAAFIYNFVQLTEWPENTFTNASEPLAIGVYGDDPVTGYLDTAVKGRTTHGRAIKVTRVRRLSEAARCQALFFSLSERRNFEPLLNGLKGKPILTISEIDQFTKTGGIIRLVKKPDGPLQFEVHRTAARRAGLTLSSRLLALATIVQEKGSE